MPKKNKHNDKRTVAELRFIKQRTGYGTEMHSLIAAGNYALRGAAEQDAYSAGLAHTEKKVRGGLRD